MEFPFNPIHFRSIPFSDDAPVSGMLLTGHLHGITHYCVKQLGQRSRCPSCATDFENMECLRDHLMATQTGIARLQTPAMTQIKKSTVAISTFLDRIDPCHALRAKSPVNNTTLEVTDEFAAISYVPDVPTESDIDPCHALRSKSPVSNITLEVTDEFAATGYVPDVPTDSDSDCGSDIEENSVAFERVPFVRKPEDSGMDAVTESQVSHIVELDGSRTYQESE